MKRLLCAALTPAGVMQGLKAVCYMVVNLGTCVHPRNVEDLVPVGPWWASLRLMVNLERLGLALADLWAHVVSWDAYHDERVRSLTFGLQWGMVPAALSLLNFITLSTNGLAALGWAAGGGGEARRVAPVFQAAVSACLGALAALLSVLGSTHPWAAQWASATLVSPADPAAPTHVRRGPGVWRGPHGGETLSYVHFRRHVADTMEWLYLLIDCYRLAGQRWRQLDRLGGGCCPGARERFEGRTASQVWCRPLPLLRPAARVAVFYGLLPWQRAVGSGWYARLLGHSRLPAASTPRALGLVCRRYCSGPPDSPTTAARLYVMLGCVMRWRLARPLCCAACCCG